MLIDIHGAETNVAPGVNATPVAVLLDTTALGVLDVVAMLLCTVLSVESLVVPALFDTEASKVVPAKAHAPCAQSIKDCMSSHLSCAQARS